MTSDQLQEFYDGRAGDAAPNDDDDHATQQHGGATQILGSLGKLVIVEAHPIDDSFDRGIEQFDDENQQERSDQQRPLAKRQWQEDGKWQEYQRQKQLLPKRMFVQERCRQSGLRIEKCAPDAHQPAFAFVWTFQHCSRLSQTHHVEVAILTSIPLSHCHSEAAGHACTSRYNVRSLNCARLTSRMPSPTATPAWQSLAKLAAQRDLTSKQLSPLTANACGICADFSRQHLPAAVLDTLLALENEQHLSAARDAQFSGIAINRTENQPVLHTALRANKRLVVGGIDVNESVQHQLKRMRKFVEAIRSGRIRSVTEQAFTDVVAIGIGGSSLGPRLACEALARLANGPRVHFVSNVDGAQLEDTLHGLNPATTLFLVTSKTFTTDETMSNARTAQLWLDQRLGMTAGLAASTLHFVAITANPAEAKRQGYPEDRVFEFWGWVGGRFSLWSTVGMPVALATGVERFDELLAGARAMDEHFCNASPADNLPVLLALVGVWNRNFLGIAGHALLPYAHRLRDFPTYAQQLEMESNGKSVDLDGKSIDYPTCPVIFGEAGTDGQHSFHQLLHQGSEPISSDIILVARDESKFADHHDKLLANGIAQADALWFGRGIDVALTAHRVHEGGRPVTVLVLPELNAFSLGALIALYEHKVFVQGVIWNINSYDQWGVELGKTIATSLHPLFTGDQSGVSPIAPSPHLAAITAAIRQSRVVKTSGKTSDNSGAGKSAA